MFSFKFIAFVVSAVFVNELMAARISFNCENGSSNSISSESDEQNPLTSPTEMGLTTVVYDIKCLSKCPSSMQQSPVCGTNGVTYPSMESLECAKSCGVDVDLVSNSPCPTSGLQLFS